MGSDHNHSHSHSAPTHINRAFVVGIILNSAFVIIETIAGFSTHSLGLLAITVNEC
jgi:cobalt-zinc-cadmium efflux system protein